MFPYHYTLFFVYTLLPIDGFLLRIHKKRHYNALRSGDHANGPLRFSAPETTAAAAANNTSSSPSASSSRNNNRNNNKQSSKVTTRYVAARALMEATSKKEADFSLRKLENDKAFQGLELRDRGFTRLLVSTVERRKGQIDKVLGHCMNISPKPPKRKVDSLVQAALRVGAAQLLFLHTPSHAAVKETVDILRMNPQIKVPEAKVKYANAVLRRITREGQDLLESITSSYDNLAPWLQNNWRKAYGQEKLNTIAEAFMMEPPVYLSVNHALGSSPEEKDAKIRSIQSAFESQVMEDDSNSSPKTHFHPHGSLCIDKERFPGAVSKWPLYNEGEWWVQDASATLPAIALYNVLSRADDEFAGDDRHHHVVDLCAAPGGKTAQLLSLGFPTVTAIEFSARRARQLQTNMQRLQLEDRCDIVVADGTKWIPSDGKESVSGVLLDVPCTATGTASRRPDVLRRDDNLSQILETQYSLATHCADSVLTTGGVMVYATCSLLKEESEEQVLKLLARTDGARLTTVPFSEGEIPGFDDAIDEHGWLRVIPGWLPGELSTCDGFFVARLRKG